jgi:hypothetical protein
LEQFKSLTELTFKRFNVFLAMKTQQSKRATVYLDPDLHKALKIKSAHCERTLSDLVNSAVRQSLAEDYEDLLAFEERQDEPNLDFEKVLKKLKVSGKL